MNHHVSEQITGRPYLHDMFVSRFVGASVASAVRWVDACLDRWLSCYPLPGKSSAQVGKPYSSGEARIAVSSREELAALSGRVFGWGILCRFYAGGAHVFILVRFSDIWHTHCAATLFPAWQEDIAASDNGGKSSNLAAFPFPLDLAAFPSPGKRSQYAGISFAARVAHNEADPIHPAKREVL